MDDLGTLVRCSHPLILLRTWEEARALEAASAAARELHIPLLTWSATEGLRKEGESEPVYKTEKAPMLLAHLITSRLRSLCLAFDFQPYLEDAFVQRAIKDLMALPAGERPVLVLCGPDFTVPPGLEKDAFELDLKPPPLKELRKLFLERIQEANQTRRIALQIQKDDFEKLVAQLEGLTVREAVRIMDLALLDERISVEDLKEAARYKQKLVEQSGILEMVAAPPSLDKVAGLVRLKDWLAKRSRAFTKEARDMGLDAPKGILLLGVQGCGKSLCAKAVAAAWGMPLVRLDPASLFDKYIGESEKNLKRALEQADRLAPCVLWIDEIEKALAQGDGDGQDGGLSRRILGSFLFWMQERPAPVFLIATSNDISRLPPELLRKGRFDEIFFVDLPSEAARGEIFRIHLSQRKQDPAAFDLGALSKAAEGFSGAEIEQAVVDALYEVLAGRKIDTGLLEERIRATRPLSVVMAEKVEDLRAWARERAVPAD